MSSPSSPPPAVPTKLPATPANNYYDIVRVSAQNEQTPLMLSSEELSKHLSSPSDHIPASPMSPPVPQTPFSPSSSFAKDDALPSDSPLSPTLALLSKRRSMRSRFSEINPNAFPSSPRGSSASNSSASNAANQEIMLVKLQEIQKQIERMDSFVSDKISEGKDSLQRYGHHAKAKIVSESVNTLLNALGHERSPVHASSMSRLDHQHQQHQLQQAVIEEKRVLTPEEEAEIAAQVHAAKMAMLEDLQQKDEEWMSLRHELKEQEAEIARFVSLLKDREKKKIDLNLRLQTSAPAPTPAASAVQTECIAVQTDPLPKMKRKVSLTPAEHDGADGPEVDAEFYLENGSEAAAAAAVDGSKSSHLHRRVTSLGGTVDAVSELRRKLREKDDELKRKSAEYDAEIELKSAEVDTIREVLVDTEKARQELETECAEYKKRLHEDEQRFTLISPDAIRDKNEEILRLTSLVLSAEKARDALNTRIFEKEMELTSLKASFENAVHFQASASTPHQLQVARKEQEIMVSLQQSLHERDTNIQQKDEKILRLKSELQIRDDEVERMVGEISVLVAGREETNDKCKMLQEQVLQLQSSLSETQATLSQAQGDSDLRGEEMMRLIRQIEDLTAQLDTLDGNNRSSLVIPASPNKKSNPSTPSSARKTLSRIGSVGSLFKRSSSMSLSASSASPSSAPSPSPAAPITSSSVAQPPPPPPPPQVVSATVSSSLPSVFASPENFLSLSENFFSSPNRDDSSSSPSSSASTSPSPSPSFSRSSSFPIVYSAPMSDESKGLFIAQERISRLESELEKAKQIQLQLTEHNQELSDTHAHDLQQTKSEITSLSAELHSKSEECESMQSELDQLRSDLAHQQQELMASEHDLMTFSAELNASQQQQEELNQQIAQLKQQLQDAQESLQTSTAQSQEQYKFSQTLAQSQILDLNSQVQLLTSTSQSLEAELSATQAKLLKSQQMAADTEKQLAEKEAEYSEFQNMYIEKEINLDRLMKQRDELEAELEVVNSQRKAVESATAAAVEDKRRAVEDKDRVVEELSTVRVELIRCQSQLASAHRVVEELSSVRGEFSNCQSQLISAQQQILALQSVQRELETIMSASKETQQKQVMEYEALKQQLTQEANKCNALQQQLSARETEVIELQKYNEEIKNDAAQVLSDVEILQYALAEKEQEYTQLEGKLLETEEQAALSANHLKELGASAVKMRSRAKEIRSALSVMTGECRELVAKQAVMAKDQMDILWKAMSKQLEAQWKEGRDLQVRYKYEVAERRRLFNQLQEMRGNIRVMVRCRPLLPADKEPPQALPVVTVDAESGHLYVVMADGGNRRPHIFEFDHSFGQDSTQAQIFHEIESLTTSVLDGYNATCFAYGQTGAGKTWTMEGSKVDPGVNIRTIQRLFELKAEREASGWVFEPFTVSVLEIYNENVFDLLLPPKASREKKLEIRQAQNGSIVVPDLSQVRASKSEDVMSILQQGSRNRSVSETKMNDSSSRSHCLLFITVTGQNVEANVSISGKLCLIDLAGSERIAKNESDPSRIRESQAINASLSSLGDVISALASKEKRHIPFRNSKLTYLLQDCLNGDSKVMMIANISPSSACVAETLCTLNFAQRCATVQLGGAKANVSAVSSSSSSAAASPASSSPALSISKSVSSPAISEGAAPLASPSTPTKSVPSGSIGRERSSSLLHPSSSASATRSSQPAARTSLARSSLLGTPRGSSQ